MSKAKQDNQTVTPEGKELKKLPNGVHFKEATTHIDDRGSVVEMFDERWRLPAEPLVFAYCYTVRPGKIKGWGMHKKHEDRYFILFGELEIVLYDARPKSATRGLVSKVYLSEKNRRLMNIPPGVWHACHNVGQTDVVVVNFPTIPYKHAKPDKYRLPIDTDQIPYSFDTPAGW